MKTDKELLNDYVDKILNKEFAFSEGYLKTVPKTVVADQIKDYPILNIGVAVAKFAIFVLGSMFVDGKFKFTWKNTFWFVMASKILIEDINN
jgi:hypothetical protein